MKFLNNIKRSISVKLCRKNGVTLIEMIAATAVLLLLSMMLTTGLFVVQKSYNKVTIKSETQLLLSTVSNVLYNELRYARDVVEKSGTLERYTSINYGKNATISLSDEGHLVSNNKDMIATGAYGNGDYKISYLEIKYDGNSTFDVSIKVEGKFGIFTETQLYINCLNGS